MCSLSYNHTCSVLDGQDVYGRCCSFETAVLKRGRRRSVHKATVLKALENVDAVVKVARDFQADCDDLGVHPDIKMFNFAREVVRQCPKAQKTVTFARTFQSEIDKVGKGYRLKRMLSKGDDNLCEGAQVVVQEYVPEKIKDLFDMKHHRTSSHAEEPLLELVHESYKMSNGSRVIAKLKGAKCRDQTGRVTYHVTSLTIHSLGKEYGETDQGKTGVLAYEEWSSQSRLCVQPSAPSVDTLNNNNSNNGSPYSPHPHPLFIQTPYPFSPSQLNIPSPWCLEDNRRQEVFMASRFMGPPPVSFDRRLVAGLGSNLPAMYLEDLLGPPPAYTESTLYTSSEGQSARRIKINETLLYTQEQ